MSSRSGATGHQKAATPWSSSGRSGLLSTAGRRGHCSGQTCLKSNITRVSGEGPKGVNTHIPEGQEISDGSQDMSPERRQQERSHQRVDHRDMAPPEQRTREVSRRLISTQHNERGKCQILRAPSCPGLPRTYAVVHAGQGGRQ